MTARRAARHFAEIVVSEPDTRDILPREANEPDVAPAGTRSGLPATVVKSSLAAIPVPSLTTFSSMVFSVSMFSRLKICAGGGSSRSRRVDNLVTRIPKFHDRVRLNGLSAIGENGDPAV